MFKLSASQEIVWLHEELAPGSRAYNFTATFDLRGTLNVDALGEALAIVIERHAALRLELVARPGKTPVQRIRKHCAPRLRFVDLSGEDDPKGAFEDLLATEARTPLDTFEAPLLRWVLIRLSERHHRMVHVEHHLIHDGRSFALLLNEIFASYRAQVLGEDLDLPPAGSYEDHVLAQGEASQESIEFWRGELDGAAFDLPLPGVSKVRAPRTGAGNQLRQGIDSATAQVLRAVCRERGHTPFVVLLGLFAELLRRHSGRDDVVIGTAVGNRPPGTETTIGMFVNTIPLRLRLDPDATAAAALDDVIETLFHCLPHQDVPVQTITRAMKLHTDGAANPLFDVMFSAHDAVLPNVVVPDLEISLFEGLNTGTTRFDLDVVLIPDDQRVVGARSDQGGMILIWDFDRERFTDKTVLELQDRFLTLLKAYLAAPDMPIASLAAPSAVAPVGAGATDSSVLDDWRHHATDSTVIISGSDRITYGELDRRVTDLAAKLSTAGVRRGHPVAVVQPRGIPSIIALLACLRLAAVYCPLSPDDPPARTELLLRRLNPALVLTTAASAPALDQGLPVALQDRGTFPEAATVPVIDGDAAYVIHTSGSTGTPKPVVVGRAALAEYVGQITARYSLTAQDRALHFAQPVFDVALEEVLPTLHVGACLVVPHREVPTPAELVGVLAVRQVSVANLPTSYVLAAQEEMSAALEDGRWSPRLIVLGGERLPAGAVTPLRAATDSVILNAYGVTEATITTTTHEVTDEHLSTDDVPLGVELPGIRVYVVDNGRWPLPDGAIGELAVAGTGLATGYLGDDVATAARFPKVAGERVYLTGDLGYRDAAGRVCFLGRVDNQVKLRGYRIELEEIESVAAQVLGLPGCVVVLDQASDTPRLVGFCTGVDDVDQAFVHAALAERLPAALVPAHWVRLDAMPTLSGGKPDRGALTKLAADARPAEVQPFDEFGDAMQSLVARGWQGVLGHDRFTSSSDFFRVGGHSMLLAQLAAWLEAELGSRPPLRILFQHSVLAEQADAVRELAS